MKKMIKQEMNKELQIKLEEITELLKDMQKALEECKKLEPMNYYSQNSLVSNYQDYKQSENTDGWVSRFDGGTIHSNIIP